MTEPKIKTNKDWLVIAIFALICTVTWVATNAYHSYVNKKEIVVKNELLTPLTADIDQSLFDTLETRNHLSEEELVKILSEAPNLLQTPPITSTEEEALPTPTPLLTPTEEEAIPTPSPLLTPAEEETPTPVPQEKIPESQ